MENKFTKYTLTQKYGMEGIGDIVTCDLDNILNRKIMKVFKNGYLYYDNDVKDNRLNDSDPYMVWWGKVN